MRMTWLLPTLLVVAPVLVASGCATSKDLEPYATKDELSGYATKADLEALRSELMAEIRKDSPPIRRRTSMLWGSKCIPSS